MPCMLLGRSLGALVFPALAMGAYWCASGKETVMAAARKVVRSRTILAPYTLGMHSYCTAGLYGYPDYPRMGPSWGPPGTGLWATFDDGN